MADLEDFDSEQLILDGFDMEPDDVDEDDGRMTDDEIETLVSGAIQDAIDFIDTEIAPGRLKANRYCDGEVDIGDEEGRSKLVATKVRDTVRAVKPSLLRIFLSSTAPVQFLPNNTADADQADEQTRYITQLFLSSGGYLRLLGLFDDTLKSKTGIMKTYRTEVKTTTHHTLTNISQQMVDALGNDPELKVIAMSPLPPGPAMPGPDGTPMPPQPMFDLEVLRTVTKARIEQRGVAPERFFVDSGATAVTPGDYFIVGHVEEMPVGDVMALGFSEEELDGLDGLPDNSATGDQEEEQRRKYIRNRSTEEATADPMTRKMALYEAYIRMDVERTGELVLYKVLMGGSKMKLLSYEPVDDNPFAVFQIDPVPHTFFGNSTADLVIADQDTATSILRGIVDNIHAVNTPRLAVVEDAVNMDDVMNNEIGAIVRMRQMGAVQPLEVPFSAGQTLGALQYIDQMVEQKTGVTRASMGLDPDAMQSTTKDAARNTIAAAAGQVEVMARSFAETGMVRMFTQMLKLAIEIGEPQEPLDTNGTLKMVDPRSWKFAEKMRVNVGTGTGDVDRKKGALTGVLSMQMQIWSTYGPQNGVISMTGIHNTMVDLLALDGIHNTARYINPMDPQKEQQLLQAQAQAAQAQQANGPQDPTAQALLAAEKMKAEVKGQSDSGKLQVDMIKAAMQDDRERDKMAQDFELEQTRLIGELGVRANEIKVKAEQERQRNNTPTAQ